MNKYAENHMDNILNPLINDSPLNKQNSNTRKTRKKNILIKETCKE